MLSRAAMFAGRNFFGTRSASGVAYAGAAAIAAAAGATTALADKKEKSFIMLKPVCPCRFLSKCYCLESIVAANLPICPPIG